MAPLSNTDGFQKDTEAVQVEKLASHDVTHTPKDLDAILTEEEKNAVSHRFRALEKLREYLQSVL